MIAWLLGTTVGRTLLKWTGIAALLAAGYWRIYANGKASASAERVSDELNAMKERDRIDDKVRKMDGGALDRELARWVRD